MTQEMNREKSEFNFSIDFLRSISFLLGFANMMSVDLDVYYWYHALKALKRSIITECTSDDLINLGKIDNQIKPLIAKHLKTHKNNLSTSVNPELYDLLEEFHNNIMIILKKSGMSLKTMDLPEYALGYGKDF